MTPYVSGPQLTPFPVLVKMFRRIREAGDRRFLRYVQRRAQWIDEARNAPTGQSRIDDIAR